MLALVLSIGVAVVYVAILRFLDLNEREPLWAVLMLLVLGFAAAGVLGLAMPSRVLELSVLPGATAEEAAKFLAIAAGFVLLQLAASSHGWSELNGTMDGIVYGGAAGLGFAAGETLARELALAATPVEIIAPPFLVLLWTNALAGVSHGVFAAFTGMGLAAAVHSRSLFPRAAYVFTGLIAAILANGAHRVLAFGGSLGGPAALLRTWVALALPLLLVIVVAVYALIGERRAIVDELAGEAGDGAVTPRDLELLRSHARRNGVYWSVFLRGDFTRGLLLHSLHNRQVQLALAKRRAARESHQERRAQLQQEVDALRAAVHDRRKRLAALAPHD
jgi:RsiW-degrading membrane proteinase PrsW (M82 family)